MTEFIDHEENTAKRKETDAQRRKRLKADIEYVLATPQGRHVLSEILALCQVESVNGANGDVAARIEGARAVGINTINLLRSNDFAGWMNLYREIHNG